MPSLLSASVPGANNQTCRLGEDFLQRRYGEFRILVGRGEGGTLRSDRVGELGPRKGDVSISEYDPVPVKLAASQRLYRSHLQHMSMRTDIV